MLKFLREIICGHSHKWDGAGWHLQDDGEVRWVVNYTCRKCGYKSHCIGDKRGY